MRTPSSVRRRHLVRTCVIVVSLAMLAPAPGRAADPVDDLIAALEDAVAPLDDLVLPSPPEQPAAEPARPGDPLQPEVALREILAELDDLIARSTAPSLPVARAAVSDAFDAYIADDPVLANSVASMRDAIDAIAQAAIRDARDQAILDSAADRLVQVARRLAVGVVGVAERGGVDRTRIDEANRMIATGDALLDTGDRSGAVAEYGKALGVGSLLVFDLDVFEDEIKSTVGPNVVGYAYAIAKQGQLAREGGGGLARTAADAPQTAHGPLKEQFVASVSKTITAVGLLKVLQDAGVSIDSSISPWLPPAWPKGPGVASLTFRHLLTHRSGFPGSTSSSYTGLRDRIAAGATPNAPFAYANANFGLMRVLIPWIWPTSRSLFLGFPLLANATGHQVVFRFYVRTVVFGPMGFDADCLAQDGTPFRFYDLPHGNKAGAPDEDQRYGCGGFGWNLSAREIAQFLSHTRYNTSILSASTRVAMDAGWLGWMDPANYSFDDSFALGSYRMHGGDWFRPAGELHTCAASFPSGIQVGLVMNSKRGFSSYQCKVLGDAYEAAWVAS